MDLWTNFKLFRPKLSLNCLNRTRNWLELTLVYFNRTPLERRWNANGTPTECRRNANGTPTERRRNADGMPTERQRNADGMPTKLIADDGVLQKGKQAF